APTISVAEFAITLALAIAKNIVRMHVALKGGEWRHLPGTELRASRSASLVWTDSAGNGGGADGALHAADWLEPHARPDAPRPTRRRAGGVRRRVPSLGRGLAPPARLTQNAADRRQARAGADETDRVSGQYRSRRARGRDGAARAARGAPH